jgi:single-strand DNA-binding protein
MGFFNKCILLGNVTRNPDVRTIPGSGTPVAKFGLAVNRRYKSGNDYKDETCFIDIVAFGRLAEISGEYITKGVPVLVEGRLSFNTWEQEGVKRSKHEIIAENIQLVERKNSGTYNNNTSSQEDTDKTVDEDDIPF